MTFTKIEHFKLFEVNSEDVSLLNEFNTDFCSFDPYHKYGLLWQMLIINNYNSVLNIDKQTFFQFMVVLQENYDKSANPFHNFDHGFNVAHATFYFIKIDANNLLSIEQNISLLISALSHDVGHTGRTNAFEISS